MSQSISPEAIKQFRDITNASLDTAKAYLQVLDGKVDEAVSLYLETGGEDLGPIKATVESSSATSSQSPLYGNSDNFSGDYEYIDDDEELARKLIEEDTHMATGVRAPIAPKTDVLIGGNDYDGRSSRRTFGMSTARSPLYVSDPRAPSNIFNQGDSSLSGSNHDAFRDFAAETAAFQSSSQRTEKTKKLAELFRPPFDMMFRGDFELARITARNTNKWLMVNIQNPSEFPCQVMNRDLWSDKDVKDTVKKYFIFLQYTNESAEGKKYLSFYPIDSYPHVAIIDPKTGERMNIWNTVEQGEFLKNVREFLGPAYVSESSSVAAKKKVDKSEKLSRNISDMTEEEQLNAAIAASLAASKSGTSSVVDLTKDEDVVMVDDEEQARNDPGLLQGQPVGIKDIKAVMTKEPPAGPGVTKIQFRLPDGKRVVRRFNKDDLVKSLFEYIRAEIDEAKEQDFELVFNRQQLIEQIEQTVEEAKVENALVTVAWS